MKKEGFEIVFTMFVTGLTFLTMLSVYLGITTVASYL